MTTVLLTGTRAPVAVELADALHAAGHRVVTADSRTSLLTGNRRIERGYRVPSPRWEPAAFADAITGISRRHGVTRIVPVCEEAVWLAACAERPEHAALRPLLVAPRGDVARALHHKGAFVRTLERLGIAAPRTIELSDARAARSAHRELRARKVVFKPVHSRFGEATRIVGAHERLDPIPAIGPGSPWVAQEFLAGEEYCVTAFLRAGTVQGLVVYRPEWRARASDGSIGSALRFEALADGDPIVREARAIVERLGDALALDGFIGLDAIANERGLVPIECNPRPTSGVHLFGEGLGDALAGGSEPLRVRRGSRAARRVPFASAGWALRDPSRWARSRSVLAGRVPIARQVRVLAQLATTARRHGVTLATASTIDIAFDGTQPPRGGRAATIEFPAQPDGDEWGDAAMRVLGSSEGRIPNAPAPIVGMRVGAALLPVALPAPPGSAYPSSIVSHFIDTARDELHELRSPRLERAVDAVLRAARPLVVRLGLNEALSVDNALLSTTLHPELTLADVRAIGATLARALPALAVAWRGVHGHDSELATLLRESGHVLVPARSILFVDPAASGATTSRDARRDAALLDDGLFHVRRITEPSPAEADRVARLYEQLYRVKYTAFSPAFTGDFVRAAVREGMLELAVLERNGRIDGAIAWYERGGMLTAPLVGYDTSLPPALGLYRRLMTMLADEARARGVTLHASSGVPGFKGSRGGQRRMEYLAVDVGHLPPGRRIAWRVVGATLDAAATALVDRFTL